MELKKIFKKKNARTRVKALETHGVGHHGRNRGVIWLEHRVPRGEPRGDLAGCVPKNRGWAQALGSRAETLFHISVL